MRVPVLRATFCGSATRPDGLFQKQNPTMSCFSKCYLGIRDTASSLADISETKAPTPPNTPVDAQLDGFVSTRLQTIPEDFTWAVQRSLTDFSLNILYRGEIIPIPLQFEELHLIGEISGFQEYFDRVVSKSPRVMKLIDRILSYHRRTVVYDYLMVKHFHEMLWYLAVLMPNKLLEYHEVVVTLDIIQRWVFYGIGTGEFGDFAIELQSASTPTPRKGVLDVKQICNQSREMSSRQIQRLRREIEMREQARLKALDEKMKVPHDERKRRRQAERKSKRFAKNLFIQEQGGLRAALLFLPRTVGAVASLPLNIGRTAANLAKATKRAARVDVESISRHLQGTLEQARQTTAAVGDAVVEVKNQFFMYLQDTLNGVKNMLKGQSELVIKVIISVFLVVVYCKFSTPIIRAALEFAFGYFVGRKIVSLMRDIFQAAPQIDNPGNIVEQDGGVTSLYIDSGLLSKVLGVVLTGTLLSSVKMAGNKHFASHILSSLALAPRAFKGIEELIEVSLGLIEKGFNAVRSWFNKDPIRLAKKHEKELNGLVERVYTIDTEISSGKCSKTPSRRYTYLSSLLSEINAQLVIHSINRDLKMILLELKRTVEKLLQPLRQCAGAGVGYRPQPVTLLIAGEPGIGKTTITQASVISVMGYSGYMDAEFNAEYAGKCVFTKPKDSPYWDGYEDNFAVVIDDLLAVKPVPGQPNEATELMTLHGSTTTILNMAELERKGAYPFLSPFIFMTTNARDHSQTGIDGVLNFPDAFNRRIDFHLLVQVKPEYRLPGSVKLDFFKFEIEHNKLRENEGEAAYPWHIWECMPIKFGVTSDFPPGTGQELLPYLKAVGEKIKINRKFHEMQMDTFERMVRGMRPGSDDEPEITPACSGIVEQTGLNEMETLANRIAASSMGDLSDQEDSDDEDESFTIQAHGSAESRTCGLSMEEFQRRVRDAYERGYMMGAKKVLFTFIKLYTITTVSLVALRALYPLLAGIFKGAWDMISSFLFGKKTDDIEEQSNGPRPKKTQVRFIQQQNGGDVPLWQRVYNNSYKMLADMQDGTFAVFGQLLFLQDGICVMPHHFIREIETKLKDGRLTEEHRLVLRSCSLDGTEKVISIRAFMRFQMYRVVNRDLVFVDFGRNVHPHKHIVKHILRSDEIDQMGGERVRLDTARVADKNGELVPFNERITMLPGSVQVGRVPITIGTPEAYTKHSRWLRYGAITEQGDCGAILSLTSHCAYECRLVAGLHVGFDTNAKAAYATPLDKELCEEAVAFFGSNIPSFATAEQSGWAEHDVKVTPSEVIPFNDEGRFGTFLPCAELDKGVSAPIRSNKEQTIFGFTKFFGDQIKELNHGREPDELAVMKLGVYTDKETGEKVMPMEKALAPFATNIRIVDSVRFGLAVSTAMQPFRKATRHVLGKTLSYKEAVIGNPILGLRAITRGTSVGVPCVISTGASDKSYFFGKGDEFDLNTEEALQLEREVADLQSLLESDVRPFFVCRDFLKDEVRKVSKNARLIAGTDIRYYILCRMYFGAYVAALVKYHQDSGICLGMNQYSEWGWLREFLLRPDPTGKNVWDGDFAGFDTSQVPSMLWPILDEINGWYEARGSSQQESRIREILFYDLVYSRHVCSLYGEAKTVVQWQKSLPSGHFLTSTVNSILSMSCITSAYISIIGDPMSFWDNAAVVTQGDDNVVSASDNVIERFNQVTVSEHIKKEFGMVYTAGRKGEELTPTVGIDRVVFLQRTFGEKNGFVTCPIRPESFLHSLYYTKKGSERYVKEVLKDGLERALEELALYPEEDWTKVAPRICEAMAEIGEVPQLSVKDSRMYFEQVRNRVPDFI